MRDYNKDFKFKYVLNKIHGKIFIKKIIAFDTETHDNNQQFTLGSTYDGTEHKIYYDKETMRKYLLDKRHQNTLLCATNLQFDFCALEDLKNFKDYNIISRSGRFIQVKKQVKYENKKYQGHDVVFANVFIDSLNHYAGSVESAGKIINIHKLEQPYFLGQEPRNSDEWNELLTYNKQDTKVTYELMKFLQDTYNHLGCEMKTTISSTALDLWKRKYLPCELIREDYILGFRIKDEIFKTYYGGRTEIYGRGLLKSTNKKKWRLLDFNSLYPSCMLNKFPLPQSIVKPENKTIENIKEYEGFSDVEIECDYMFYPLLPYRDFKLGKLIFPVGRWRSSYTHLELRRALELGYRINKIHSQYIYKKTFYPFRDYVNDLYNKRLEYKNDNNPMEVVVKLFLNCFSHDTNIWTKHGLKNIRDVKVGDIIYSVNPDTLETEFKEVIKTYEYDYNDEMYHIYNHRMDCLVTPNHRFLLRGTNGNNYFKEIKDIKRGCIPKIYSKIKGKNIDIIDLHKYLDENDNYDNTYWYPKGNKGLQKYGIHLKYDMKDFMSLLGWFISEGSLYYRNGCYFVKIHQKKEHYRNEIENLLQRMNIIYTKSDSQFEIYDKVLFKFFITEVGKYQINRIIPRFVFNLDSSYLESLYNSMMSGDGYKGLIFNNKRKQSRKYTTISKQLAYDFQQLCIHLGIHSKVLTSKKVDKNSKHISYIVYENYSKDFRLETQRKSRINIFKTKNNSDKVYCVEVKDNHTLIVERNGKILTTGQSLYGKLAQRDFIEYQWFDISKMTSHEYNDYLDSNNTSVNGDIGFKRIVRECDTNFIFPILASYVTSYGRLKIHDALVKYEGVYADTDSVITCIDIEDSNKLGELKIEDTLKKAILIRPKLYLKHDEFDNIKIKVKGIPRVNVQSFEKILQNDRVFFNKFIKPSESIRYGWNVNSVREDSKGVSLEDNKRLWSKKFSADDFDFESKPIYINDVSLFKRKHVNRKSVREKILISEQEYKKNKNKIRKQFIESDMFDINAVGSDITPEEFIENEVWFEKHGL